MPVSFEERSTCYAVWGQCLALTGEWAGESRPNNRARSTTEWRRCYIKFYPAPVGSHRILLLGGGTSIWNDQRVQFILHGSISLQLDKRHTITLVKTHTDGPTTTYQGLVNLNNRSIEGVYKKGTLALRRTSGPLETLLDPGYDSSLSRRSVRRFSSSPPPAMATDMAMIALVSKLSGSWSGESCRLNKKVTIWRDVEIEFNWDSHGTLIGSGISEWKGKCVPFKLSGEFTSLERFAMYKCHWGEYTTATTYEVTVDPDSCTITGVFGKGTLLLTKVNDDVLECSSDSYKFPRRQDSSSLPLSSSPRAHRRSITRFQSIEEFDSDEDLI